MLAPPPSLLSPLPQLQRMPEGVHPSVLPHHYLLIHAGRECSYISSCWITFLKLKMRNIFLRSFVWDFYSVHLQIPESGGKTITSLNILDFLMSLLPTWVYAYDSIWTVIESLGIHNQIGTLFWSDGAKGTVNMFCEC